MANSEGVLVIGNDSDDSLAGSDHSKLSIPQRHIMVQPGSARSINSSRSSKRRLSKRHTMKA